jgi:hypothetical protein
MEIGRRHRWRARRPVDPTVPMPSLDSEPGRSVSLPGALVPRNQLRLARAPSLGEVRPTPWDLFNIVAVPASGSTVQLIGPTAARQLGRVPLGYRCVLHSISPYLEGAAGPITQPRIPGPGVTITWSLLFDGKFAPYYATVQTLLDGWGATSTHSLLEVPEGTQLRAQVTYVDPGGLYSFVGIRLRGQFIPWSVQGPTEDDPSGARRP